PRPDASLSRPVHLLRRGEGGRLESSSGRLGRGRSGRHGRRGGARGRVRRGRAPPRGGRDERAARDRGEARMTRVLVFAAHPDDEILGMGGTIALHTAVRGDETRIVCVTDGSSSQYPNDAALRGRKNDEARRAALELGVEDYVHLDLPDMRLDTVPHVDVNRIVEEQIRDLRPEVVYAPHPDVN